MVDNKLRVKILTTAGAPMTGMTYATSGLVIATIGISEAVTTAYTGANIEDIAVLGTYVEPTAGKCRFKEVDATNHPGLYEIQLASARMGLYITIYGAAGMAQCDTSTTLPVQLDAQLSSTHGAGRWAEQGSGYVAWQYIVNDCITHLPVDGVWVNVSTDAAGANIIAQGVTNSFGQVVFWLDPGTYYMWAYRCGYYFPLPDTEVVTAP